jgi:hypothetical protein
MGPIFYISTSFAILHRSLHLRHSPRAKVDRIVMASMSHQRDVVKYAQALPHLQQ